MKVVNETNQKVNRRMGTICLMIGMFLNPFGYDILTKMVMDITGSYWTTMHIFYLAAGLFFGLSFYFYRTNPIKACIAWVNDIKTKIAGLIER